MLLFFPHPWGVHSVPHAQSCSVFASPGLYCKSDRVRLKALWHTAQVGD